MVCSQSRTYISFLTHHAGKKKGRNTASKPLHSKSATPSSAHAQNQSKLGSTTSSAIADKPVTRTPSVNSIASSTKSNSSAQSHTSSQGAESLTEQFKVTKLSSTTVKLSSTWTPPAPPSKVCFSVLFDNSVSDLVYLLGTSSTRYYRCFASGCPSLPVDIYDVHPRCVFQICGSYRDCK